VGKQGLRILVAVLIALISFNTVFLVFTMRSNHSAARAYEERHALVSAIYEASIAGGAFTRLARYYAIAGDDSTYELFRAEVALDRYGQTLDTFLAFGVTEREMELFQDVTERRMLMLDIHQEVVRLRREGYIEESLIWHMAPNFSA